MKQYLNLVKDVLHCGEPDRSDRTGVSTISLFGPQMTFDLRKGFPIITTKKILFDKVIKELLWFIRGDTNIESLGDAKNIWEPWADDNGELGPIYGEQLRGHFARPDQLKNTIGGIQVNPYSRRHIISLWAPEDLPDMSLPPCHGIAMQFYVGRGFTGEPMYLDLKMYQRSGDVALGVPWNISSYSLLLSLVARKCGLIPRYFIHSLGDAHIYSNHVKGLEEQLKRETLPLPVLSFSGRVYTVEDLAELEPKDIHLVNYKHHPFIKFKVAV